jgi:hypothetical protein
VDCTWIFFVIFLLFVGEAKKAKITLSTGTHRNTPTNTAAPPPPRPRARASRVMGRFNPNDKDDEKMSTTHYDHYEGDPVLRHWSAFKRSVQSCSESVTQSTRQLLHEVATVGPLYKSNAVAPQLASPGFGFIQPLRACKACKGSPGFTKVCCQNATCFTTTPRGARGFACVFSSQTCAALARKLSREGR